MRQRQFQHVVANHKALGRGEGEIGTQYSSAQEQLSCELLGAMAEEHQGRDFDEDQVRSYHSSAQEQLSCELLRDVEGEN